MTILKSFFIFSAPVSRFPGIFSPVMAWLFLSAAQLTASPFSIDSFQIFRVVPQYSEYIFPLRGERLEAVDSYDLGVGELLLRRKFGKDEYALFRGRADEGRLNQLCRMELPPGIPLEDVIKAKFYEREGEDYWKDLGDVYFNSRNEVFVVNKAAVHFFHGDKWYASGGYRQAEKQDIARALGELTAVNVSKEELSGSIRKSASEPYRKNVTVAFIYRGEPSLVNDYWDRSKKAVVLEFHDMKLGPAGLDNVNEYPVLHSEAAEYREGIMSMVRIHLYSHSKFSYRIEKHYGSVFLKFTTKSKNESAPSKGFWGDLMDALGF